MAVVGHSSLVVGRRTTEMISTLTVILGVTTLVFGQLPSPLGSAPGRLVDVGGHKLHINCIGPPDAKPIVVFESGGGAFSKDWLAVQTLVAKRIRTCAYDRAGLGWSDPGPAPRTLKQEVFELHTLLKSAGIRGPLILVGQSIGALNVRLYTMQHGNEVAGVVLVDPADESSMLFYLRANRWMKLRDQATGRTVPPARIAGPPSTGYKPDEDYLGGRSPAAVPCARKEPTAIR